VLSPKDIVGRILARYGFVAADVESVAGAAPGTWILDRSLDHGDGLVLVTAPVPRGAPAVGRTLDEIGFQDRHGVAPVILWRGGRFTILLPGDTVVDAASMLFLLGRPGEVADAIEHELAVPATDDRRAIIAGYGDVGAAACRELASRGVEITVVDPRDHEFPTVIGRAEDEAVLKRSGVEDARLLVVAVNDDAVNIFTTLMARNLNPDLTIVARANHPRAVDRLYRAGADFVTLQPTIGGRSSPGSSSRTASGSCWTCRAVTAWCSTAGPMPESGPSGGSSGRRGPSWSVSRARRAPWSGLIRTPLSGKATG
jgi:Trk K+ transport system NAD-binding subunit